MDKKYALVGIVSLAVIMVAAAIIATTTNSQEKSPTGASIADIAPVSSVTPAPIVKPVVVPELVEEDEILVTDMCYAFAAVMPENQIFTLTRTYPNLGLGTCDFYMDVDQEYSEVCSSLVMRYDENGVITCIPNVGPMCDYVCDIVNE